MSDWTVDADADFRRAPPMESAEDVGRSLRMWVWAFLAGAGMWGLLLWAVVT